MLRSTFSTTTMASSTTMPTASTSPNSDRLFSEKPNIAIRKKVPISETGMATSGMMAARQVCRNSTTTRTTSRIASRIVSIDGVDRLLDELGRVVDDVVFEPCGNRLDASAMVLRMSWAVASAFEPGRLEYRDRDRRIEVEVGVRRIVEAGQARRVPTSLSRTTAFGGLLDDDIGELFGIGQPAERLHRDLERAGLVDRRLIEDTRGDLDVLGLQRQR